MASLSFHTEEAPNWESVLTKTFTSSVASWDSPAFLSVSFNFRWNFTLFMKSFEVYENENHIRG